MLQLETGLRALVQRKGYVQGIGPGSVDPDAVHIAPVRADEKGGIGKEVFLLHFLHQHLPGVLVLGPAGDAVADDPEAQAFQDVRVPFHRNVSVGDGREFTPLPGKAVGIMERDAVAFHAVQKRDSAPLRRGRKGPYGQKEYAYNAFHY